MVCLDAQGALLHNETIYPHPPQNETSRAAAKISNLVQTYKIDALPLETELRAEKPKDLCKKCITKRYRGLCGEREWASIYSASAVARAEFPDYDVTVRGSVFHWTQVDGSTQ